MVLHKRKKLYTNKHNHSDGIVQRVMKIKIVVNFFMFFNLGKSCGSTTYMTRTVNPAVV